MGLPPFWDKHGNLIFQQIYLYLFSVQINNDSKFSNMDKSLTWHILIDKISDDFNSLSEFELIVSILPSLSYAQYNELELLTKEMSSYECPSKTRWSNIIKLEKKVWFPSQDRIKFIFFEAILNIFYERIEKIHENQEIIF